MDTLKDYRDLFTFVYCLVADELERVENLPKTKCKWHPTEILTVQIVGEFVRKKTETAIYELTYEYDDLFQKKISRSSFYKQLKKYAGYMPVLLSMIGNRIVNPNPIKIIDSFPVPTKKLVRQNRGHNMGGEAKVGYNAAKDEYFFGLKIIVQIAKNGVPERATFASANVHDSKTIINLVDGQKGCIFIGDKGCGSQKNREHCSKNESVLITPMKKNQKGAKEYNVHHKDLFKKRKKVETFGSLLNLLNLPSTARSLWVLEFRCFAKMIAIAASAVFNFLAGKASILSIKIMQFG